MDEKENIENLKIFVKLGENLEHDIETCGQCYFSYNMAQVSKEMLEKGDTKGKDVIKRMIEEHRKRWENSKYIKLWSEESAAGRDPRKVFEKRGWLP